ncbi:MAG: hypothetical protein WCI48_03510 [Bacteroidota bacterium]|jgi:hypothetical protein
MQLVRNLFLLAVLALLLITGCQKESTTTPSSDARAAFTGNWSVAETWVKYSYEARIAADTNSKTGVLIYNFAGIGLSYPPAKALVSGNTITLDPNEVIGNGLVVNGSGVLSGTSTINWTYTINDGADLKHVTSTFTRH